MNTTCTRTRWITTLAIPVILALAAGQGCPSLGGPEQEPVDHAALFTEQTYTGTASCLQCHQQEAERMLSTLHWNWRGTADGIVGHEDHVHGKADLVNNFCIAVPSNEARCTECHIGYGWKDKSFDFTDAAQIDCLVCHDTSGRYAKDPQNAGMPKAGIDLQAAARSVGRPGRANCGACHFYAGGGDNVKHGDLASTLVNPTRDQDVHMGGSAGMTCQECHRTTDHRIQGAYLHSIATEGRNECTDCHNPVGLHKTEVIDLHLDSLACETCHIPYYSRSKPTVMAWYWNEAGQDINPVPTDLYGKPTYDKKKGRFVHEQNVLPVYLWYNGKTHRYMLDSPASTSQQPVVLAMPDGSLGDPDAKIYPFKKMVGKQPADAVHKYLLVPHLFGSAAGPNAYWKTFNWGPALAEGAAYAGQNYSGTYEFADTVMYLSLHHEIAPKEQTVKCKDCHGGVTGRFDFKSLGYESNPWQSGGRDE